MIFFNSIQKSDVINEELSNKLKAKEIQVENLTVEVNKYKTDLLEQQRLVQTLNDDIVKHQLKIECLTNETNQQKSQLDQLVEQLNSQQAKNNVSSFEYFSFIILIKIIIVYNIAFLSM